MRLPFGHDRKVRVTAFGLMLDLIVPLSVVKGTLKLQR